MQGLPFIVVSGCHSNVCLPGSDYIVIHGIEAERNGGCALGNDHGGGQHVVVVGTRAEQFVHRR